MRQAVRAINPRTVGWLLVAFVLTALVLAATTSREFKWTAIDYIAASLMLIVAGGLIELVVWATDNARARIIGVAAVLIAVALVWAEGAVGIFS